jgi:hypothetical protein
MALLSTSQLGAERPPPNAETMMVRLHHGLVLLQCKGIAFYVIANILQQMQHLHG